MNGPLENELKERNERLETATERLSDRELEISILQKRLEIRSSVSKKGPNKVRISCEGHKILQNLHLTFDCMYCSQKLGEDFAKFCGLLRIFELYQCNFFSLCV